MIDESVLEAEAKFIRAGVVGTGGISLQSVDVSLAERSGCLLKGELDAWSVSAEDFPFREVLTHYQAVGRLAVRPDVVATLHEIKNRLPVDRALSAWIPMTVDQSDGTYSTYFGLGYINRVIQARGPELPGPRVDAFIAAACCDLVRREIRAYTTKPRPEQLSRARATVRLLARIAELAPDAAIDSTAVLEAGTALELSRQKDNAFVSVAEHATRVAIKSIPEEILAAVRRTLLPTTQLHDEQMFLRSIQLFEGIYRQVGAAIATAITSLSSRHCGLAADQLDWATARLAVVPAVFRVLTTMPIDAFAVIRGFTNGRSAVQSQAYWRVESLCARRDQARGEIVRTTLQKVFLEKRGKLADPVRVEKSMRDLDRAWRAMKRGHWGITLKIIGTVPGTGGTSGADYLRASAKTELFPGLPEGACFDRDR